MILLGYESNNVYRCYDFKSDRIIYSRDIVIKTQNEFVSIPSSIESDTKHADGHGTERNQSGSSDETSTLVPRRSNRANKGVPPDRYGYSNINSRYMDWRKEYENKDESSNSLEETNENVESINSLSEIPTNYNEAINHANKEYWIGAMLEELSSIDKNKTWILCDLPKERKAIGCRWLFNMKNNEKGEPVRFKARLVAQGFSRKFGVDYNQTFAPVAKHSTLRILLSIASQNNYHTKHLDIKTAFLYGKLTETIFMKQPPGFEVEGHENQVCKLKRSLYGLKQAPLCWNKEINGHLLKFNYKRTISDPWVDENGDEYFILIYVDDILIISNSDNRIEEFKSNISKLFEIHVLGEACCYLGIQISKLK